MITDAHWKAQHQFGFTTVFRPKFVKNLYFEHQFVPSNYYVETQRQVVSTSSFQMLRAVLSVHEWAVAFVSRSSQHIYS